MAFVAFFDYKVSWYKQLLEPSWLDAVAVRPSSSWLDHDTQERNGSSLQATALLESYFPRKHRRSCLVIRHSVINISPCRSYRKNLPLNDGFNLNKLPQLCLTFTYITRCFTVLNFIYCFFLLSIWTLNISYLRVQEQKYRRFLQM